MVHPGHARTVQSHVKPEYATSIAELGNKRVGWSSSPLHPFAGSNHYGQLGDGSITDSSVPVAVLGGGSWSAVSTGSSHTCGLKTGGALFCWGGVCVCVCVLGGGGGGVRRGKRVRFCI